MLTLPRDIARASQDIHSGPTPSKCTPLLSWADWTFDSRVLGGTKKIAGRKSGFSDSNFCGESIDFAATKMTFWHYFLVSTYGLLPTVLSHNAVEYVEEMSSYISISRGGFEAQS